MSEIPPPQYVNYPRGSDSDPEVAKRIQALSDGYFGLSKVFGLNILIVLLGNLAVGATNDNLMVVLGIVLAVLVIIGAATLPFNKKIGYGLGWAPNLPVVASILMGINSALCCGIVGYIVVQGMASRGMVREGVRRRWYGISKKDVQARLAELGGA